MNLLTKLFLFAITLTSVLDVEAGKKSECKVYTTEVANTGSVTSSNSCVTFSVGSGTGCVWMCNYCATQLGTNNYYFTNGVCSYQQGVGCVGSPQSGVQYTCCSA